MQRQQKMAFTLSVVLGFLVAGVSLTGILTPDFYLRETFNWQIQSAGQDMIDLVLVAPALLFTAQIILRTKRSGMLLTAGILLYVAYTFTIYCFDVQFNKLFYFYCLILGLSFYLFVYFIFELANDSVQVQTTGIIPRVTGIYFMVIAGMFYALWIAEIIPASLANQVPASLAAVGLPTNPVHVLDLAIMLPGIFITGLLLLRNKKMGHILTPIMLVFFILMDSTIGTLSYLMLQKGLEGSLTLTVAMGALAMLSLGLLTFFLKGDQSAVLTDPPPHR